MAEYLDEDLPFDTVRSNELPYRYIQDGKYFNPGKRRIDPKSGGLFDDSDLEKEVERTLVEKETLLGTVDGDMVSPLVGAPFEKEEKQSPAPFYIPKPNRATLKRK